MPDFKAHLFVCTNDRGPGAKRESCGPKGSQELCDTVKQLVRERGLPAGSFRVNKAGCLDQCERGMVAVLYPEGKWLENLTAADAPRLVDEIEKAVKQSR